MHDAADAGGLGGVGELGWGLVGTKRQAKYRNICRERHALRYELEAASASEVAQNASGIDEAIVSLEKGAKSIRKKLEARSDLRNAWIAEAKAVKKAKEREDTIALCQKADELSERIRARDMAALFDYRRTIRKKEPAEETEPVTVLPTKLVQGNIPVWLLGVPSSNGRAIIYHGCLSTGKPLQNEKRWLDLGGGGSQSSFRVSQCHEEAFEVRGSGTESVNGIYRRDELLIDFWSTKTKKCVSYTNNNNISLFRLAISLEDNDHLVYNASDFDKLRSLGRRHGREYLKAQRFELSRSRDDETNNYHGASGLPKLIEPEQHVDRIVTLSASRHVPPLCTQWTLLSCNDSECKKRHYYVSVKERNKWIRWRLDKEHILDRNAFEAVLQRETLLLEVSHAFTIAEDKYKKRSQAFEKRVASHTESTLQKDEEDEEENGTAPEGTYSNPRACAALAAPVLSLLEKLRHATVDTVDALTKWRQHFILQRRVVAAAMLRNGFSGQTNNADRWMVTIETTKALMPTSKSATENQSNSRHNVATTVTISKFLGVYNCVEAAIEAYEAATDRVAAERRTSVDKLPQRRERETYGGVFVIEMKRALRLSQLEATVRARLRNDREQPPPAYYCSGENYLAKMASDLNFLVDSALFQALLATDSTTPVSLLLTPKLEKNNLSSLAKTGRPESSINLVKKFDSKHIDNALDAIELEIKNNLSLIGGASLSVEGKPAQCEDDDYDRQPSDSTTAKKPPEQMRQVWTVYEDVSARLIVLQERPPLKGVLPGVFCRREIGKWKNVGALGPLSKTYWFNRRLREDGERRQRERDTIANKLRRETARGLIKARTDRIAQLLEAARAHHGGGTLAMDIRRAKELLDLQGKASILAVHCQRFTRAKHACFVVRERRIALRQATRQKQLLRDACNTMATNLTSSILSGALRLATHILRSPVHVGATTLDDGKRYIFIVNSLGTREVLDRPLEKLQLNIYDPVTQETVSLIITEAQLKTKLLEAELLTGAAAFFGVKTPLDVRDDIARLIRLESRWEPIHEEIILKEKLSAAYKLERAWWKQLADTTVLAADAGDHRESTRAQLEIANMAFAESESKIYESNLAYLHARKPVSESVERSRLEAGLLEAADIELEDWGQAHDPFEDGASVRALLSGKRDCSRSRIEHRAFHGEAKQLLSSSENNAVAAQFAAMLTEEKLVATQAVHGRSAIGLEAISKAAYSATLRRKIILNALLSQLTVITTACFGPLTRQLVFRSIDWLRAETLEQKLARSLHRFWNTAVRRIRLVQVSKTVIPARLYEEAIFRQKNAAVENEKGTAAYNTQQRMLITLRQDSGTGIYIFTAERACSSKDVEVIAISPGEVRQLVRAAGRPDLALDCVFLGRSSLFFQRTIEQCNIEKRSPLKHSLKTAVEARAERAREIADILVEELKLDPFSGALRVGGLFLARRRSVLERRLKHGDSDMIAHRLASGQLNALDDVSDDDSLQNACYWDCHVRVGRPCGIWYLDTMIARRSFQRGVLILRQLHRVAGHDVVVYVYDSWGDFRLEAYEPATGAIYAIGLALYRVLRALVVDEDFSELALLLAAVPTTNYPDKLLQGLVSRLDLMTPLNEAPRLIFHDRKDDAFINPVFQDDCAIVSSRLGAIALFSHPQGGYRIVLKETQASGPMHIRHTHYQGRPLVLDLTFIALTDIIKGAARSAAAVNAGIERIKAEQSSSHSDETISATAMNIPKPTLLDPEHIADLFDFILRRLIITDEDKACNRKSNYVQEKKISRIAKARQALSDFRQWAARVNAPLRHPGIDQITSEFRNALKESNRSARVALNSRRLALALVPLPCNERISDYKMRIPWTPRIETGIFGPHVWDLHQQVEPYTVRVGINEDGNFLIRVSRASPIEREIQSESIENVRMQFEEKHTRDLIALGEEIQVEARQQRSLAKAIRKNEEDLISRTKARRAIAATINIGVTKHEAKRNALKRKVSLIIKKASDETMSCLRLISKSGQEFLVLNNTTILTPTSVGATRANASIDEQKDYWPWWAHRDSPRFFVARRAVSLRLGQRPWIIQTFFQAATFYFEAYDPDSARRIAAVVPAFSLQSIRTGIFEAIGGGIETKYRTFAAERCLAASVASDAVEDAVINTLKVQALFPKIPSARAQITIQKSPQSLDTSILRRGVRLALLTRRFARPLEISNHAVLYIASDIDIPVTAQGISIACWMPEVRRHLCAPVGYPVECVKLSGCLNASQSLPSNAVLYFCNWEVQLEEQTKPSLNERASRLVKQFGLRDNIRCSNIYGNALWVSPGRGTLLESSEKHLVTNAPSENTASTILAEDCDRQRARCAIRAASRVVQSSRVKSVEALRTSWKVHTTKCIARYLPFVERACRVMHANISSEPRLRETIGLKALAEEATKEERLDPFDAKLAEIRKNAIGSHAEHTMKTANIHPWHLWQELVVVHACRCTLPYSVCCVPACAAARRGIIAELEKSAQDSDQSYNIAKRMKYLMESSAQARDKSRNRRTTPELLQKERLKKDDPSKRGQSRRTSMALQKSKSHRGFQGLLRRVEILLLELDSPTHFNTQMHACFVSKASALEQGYQKAREECQKATTSLMLPRALVKLLIRTIDYDANDAPTGATSEEIGNLAFDGNHTFYTWLLGRLRLKERNVQNPLHSFGTLYFDTKHGTSSLHLSGYFVRIIQPVPRDMDDPALHIELVDVESSEQTLFKLNKSTLIKIASRMSELAHHDIQNTTCADLAHYLLKHPENLFASRRRNGKLRIRHRWNVVEAFENSCDDHSEPSSSDDECGDSIQAFLHLFSPSELRERAALKQQEALRWLREKTSNAVRTQRKRRNASVSLRLLAMEWPVMVREDELSRAARIKLTAPATFLQYVSQAFTAAVGDEIIHRLVNNEDSKKALLRLLLIKESASDVEDQALEEEYKELHSYFEGQKFLTEDLVTQYWYDERLSRERRRTCRVELRRQAIEDARRLKEVQSSAEAACQQLVSVERAKCRNTLTVANPFSGFFSAKRKKKQKKEV